jgi:hypothetical protein
VAKVVIRLDPHKRVNTVVMVNGKGRCWPGRGLDVEHATDVLTRIYGESMTSERGWSHERFIEWLCDALPVLLLEIDGRGRSRAR